MWIVHEILFWMQAKWERAAICLLSKRSLYSKMKAAQMETRIIIHVYDLLNLLDSESIDLP